MSADLKDLALWKVLEKKGSLQQQAMVEALVEEASAILDRVVETFPTYTLHNATHSQNVADRMADLLGEAVKELTALEAAMLILSAYWHDIGMVVQKSERQTLTKEEHWPEFLTVHPEAEVKYAQAGNLTDELAEWYCRWRHADRVYVYLDRDRPPGGLNWGVINLRNVLGELCRSHNQDVTAILISDVLNRDYPESTDLKFCATLLRLADILDFDNSRSPDAVYRLLGLERREDKGKEQSDVEWRKHLSSGGFEFPEERPGRYRLEFSAGPTEPAVEHDVRQFLDTIEEEFERCAGLVAKCSKRWRDFRLPGDISREGIHSNGYKFGDYRFSLDQGQILNLLMGESLYEERYVFVRELIQNAIDTSRYREYYERVNGAPGFTCQPIRVSQWRDHKGRQWVRFDDHGMGMDDQIVRDHLLKVGSSFYRTARFEAEILRAKRKGAPHFVPISRFGIGLLSCFIVADRVEISSRRLKPGEPLGEPVRLSLNGLHGFYMLQTGNMPFSPMPREGGRDQGKRDTPGTSIAVRLDPTKEWSTFDAREILNKHILSSPMRIECQGSPIGQDYERFIRRPWCEPTSIPFSDEHMAALAELFSYEFSEPLQLEFVPLNLTEFSGTPEFEGQMVVAVIRPTEEWRSLVEGLKPHFELTVYSSHGINTNPNQPSFRDTTGFLVELKTHKYSDRAAFLQQLQQQSKNAPEPIKTVLPRIAQRLEQAGSQSWYQKSKPSTFGESSYAPRESTAFAVLDFRQALARLPPPLRSKIDAVDQRIPKPRPVELPSLLSHNGVLTPAYLSTNERFNAYFDPLNSRLVAHGPLNHPTLSWGAIALSDSLRPNVDVARNTLRSLPLRTYSTAIISLHGALKDAGLLDTAKNDLASLTRVVGGEPPTLGDFMNAGLTNQIGLDEIPLFELAGREMISLADLRKMLAQRSPVILRLEQGPWSYPRSFHALWAYTIARIQLRVSLGFADRSAVLHIEAIDSPDLIEGEKLFPPLMFLPIPHDWFVSRGAGINWDHPLAQWLLHAAPQLSASHPGVFQQLKSLLMDAVYGSTTRDIDRPAWVSEMNLVVSRVESLLPEFRPTESYRLTENELRDK